MQLVLFACLIYVISASCVFICAIRCQLLVLLSAIMACLIYVISAGYVSHYAKSTSWLSYLCDQR